MLPIAALRMRSPSSDVFVPIADATTLAPNWRSPNTTLSNGNLTATHDASDGYENVGSIDAKTTGKWYFEMTMVTQGSAANIAVGVGDYTNNLNATIKAGPCIMYADNGEIFRNQLNGTAFGSAWSNGDIISVALDMTGGSVKFRRNGGTWSSDFAVVGTQPYFPLVQLFRANASVTMNFGASAFAYAVPSGYSAWNKNSHAARYWRRQTIAGTGNGQSIVEASLRLTSGGSNEVGSGTASASSVFSSPTYTADKAVDGSTSTFWSSNSEQNTAWWQYDFGSGVTKAIKEVTDRTRSDFNQRFTTGTWLYSQDGTNWFPARWIEGLSWTSGETKTFSVADG